MNNFTSIFTCLLTTTIICLFGNEAMAAGKTCRDESCFAGQVADCNAGSNYTSPVIVGAQVRYSILGPHSGGCEVDMVYTRPEDVVAMRRGTTEPWRSEGPVGTRWWLEGPEAWAVDNTDPCNRQDGTRATKAVSNQEAGGECGPGA